MYLGTSAGNAGMFAVFGRMGLWKMWFQRPELKGSGLKMNHPEGVELRWEEGNGFSVSVEDHFRCLE